MSSYTKKLRDQINQRLDQVFDDLQKLFHEIIDESGLEPDNRLNFIKKFHQHFRISNVTLSSDNKATVQFCPREKVLENTWFEKRGPDVFRSNDRTLTVSKDLYLFDVTGPFIIESINLEKIVGKFTLDASSAPLLVFIPKKK